MRARFVLALCVALAVCAGCAKFPPAGSTAGFTRLSFRYTVAGNVNPNYIYIVAIRVLQLPFDPSNPLTDPTQGPIPVVDVGSKNGFVGGLPTHFVVYDETSPQLYTVYRFATKQEAPDPNDPLPVNLGVYNALGPVITGTGVDPRPTVQGGSYSNTLGFDIDTRYLAQTDADARNIQVIQFNILTMNRKVLTSGDVGTRVLDALGDQSTRGSQTFNDFRQINITTSGTYLNAQSADPERANDLFPTGSNLPDIDLVDWSLSVQTQ